MRYCVVSIRDRAADTFSAPNYAVSKGAAIRSFQDLVSDNNSPVSKHPEDYDLYYHGEFNDADGLFDCGIPQMIAVGKDYVSR